MRFQSLLMAALLTVPVAAVGQDSLRIPLDWEPHPSYVSHAVVPPFCGLPFIVSLRGGTEIRPRSVEAEQAKQGPTRNPNGQDTADRPQFQPDGRQTSADRNDSDAASEKGLDAMERYVFDACNEYRRQQGLADLELDLNLSAASRDHSIDMQARNFFSHVSPVEGKVQFTDRAARFRTTSSAENIAMGCKDGEAALQLWLESPGHRQNIVGDHRRVGIGRKDGHYTQMFGR